MKEKHQQLSNEMKSREGKLRAEIHKNEIQIYKQKKGKEKKKKPSQWKLFSKQTERKPNKNEMIKEMMKLTDCIKYRLHNE